MCVVRRVRNPDTVNNRRIVRDNLTNKQRFIVPVVRGNSRPVSPQSYRAAHKGSKWRTTQTTGQTEFYRAHVPSRDTVGLGSRSILSNSFGHVLLGVTNNVSVNKLVIRYFTPFRVREKA